MSTAIVPANFSGALSTKFANQPIERELSAGIEASYFVVGYKGKVWSIKYRGGNMVLMRDDNDGPKNSIEVVILRGSTVKSKIYYKDGYSDGRNDPPTCFSTNGVTPDPGAKERQSATCAVCPRNQWGSRITEGGKKSKACSDSKRCAVVPFTDLQNDVLGGPGLLRVPAGSLQDMAAFEQMLAQWGYPYYAVGARISFDPTEAFPKFKFEPIRPLTDEEADIVLKWRDSPQVARILAEDTPGAEDVESSPVAPTGTTVPGFGAVAQPQPEAQPTSVAQVAPAARSPSGAGGFGKANVTAAPQATTAIAEPSDFEKAIDEQLEALRTTNK